MCKTLVDLGYGTRSLPGGVDPSAGSLERGSPSRGPRLAQPMPRGEEIEESPRRFALTYGVGGALGWECLG